MQVRWRTALLIMMIAVAALLSPPRAADAANGRYLIPSVGAWVQIERRGWSAGYHPGELIQKFTEQDAVVGHTYGEEAALQLDKMKELGLKRITYELRTADAETAPACDPSPYPACKVCYALGLSWFNPTATELTNLKLFFDLVASKGMKIDLLLTTTHMEASQLAKNKRWFGLIFDTVAGHAALNLILFGGDASVIDTNGDGVADACGSQGGEPPLWNGPESYAGKFLKAMIPFAITRGITAKQLSAEAIIGDYFLDSEPPAGPSAQDRHLWKPIRVMKSIFDALGTPANQRTYATSFYQRRKCSTAQHLACTDMPPHQWAEDRLKDALAVIGNAQRRSLVMTEGGTLDPRKWPAERAFESLGFLMNKYGTGGGNFWRWASVENSEDSNPDFAKPIKRRGTTFSYFAPKHEIVDLGGYHLTAIPNGSFETGTPPTGWTASNVGPGNSVTRYNLAGEANQPQVPSRGSYALRLVTGTAASAIARVTSGTITVSPNTNYTTTGNLRFKWTGDSGSGAVETRPHVFVSFRFFQSNGQPSAITPETTFRYFQENGAADFKTYPHQYRTPADAASLRIVIGAARKGLQTAITFDADNLR